MLKLLLSSLGGVKIYFLVAAAAFSIGSYIGYSTCDYFELKEKEAFEKQVDKADIVGVVRDKKRKVVNTKQIKEIKEYVKVNPTRPGFTDDELLLYNSRR